MRQPGSLRDSVESFSKIAATSDSRPTFAIQVTANTTIRRSVLISCRDAACRVSCCVQRRRGKPRLYKSGFLAVLQSQRAYEIGDQNRLLTIGARRNQSHPRSSFFFDEGQIFTGGLG